ncbi:hypothetical protein C1N80_09870 [Brachybacterium sp. SGAir0954]|nr:hypothetical protein C1N80_09870 [Brachybacterium sp. SGAir0954]
MSRQQPTQLETDDDHAMRLRRAVERSRIALTCSLAQSPSAPALGTRLHVTFSRSEETGEFLPSGIRHDQVDREQLEVAATRARVFTLWKDGLHGTEVAKSIAHFATDPDHVQMCETLTGWWRAGRFNRATVMASQDGRALTPPGGVGSAMVARSVLYSELWHADDVSEVLNGVDSEFQLWSVAGLVGDWLAVISYQESLIMSVRPDLCASLTLWGGTPTTILRRLDVKAGGSTDATPPT